MHHNWHYDYQDCRTFDGAVVCVGLTSSFLEVSVRPVGKPAATQCSQCGSNIISMLCASSLT